MRSTGRTSSRFSRRSIRETGTAAARRPTSIGGCGALFLSRYPQLGEATRMGKLFTVVYALLGMTLVVSSLAPRGAPQGA